MFVSIVGGLPAPDAYAGQSIRMLIEAADASTASLVEAAVDDVRIMQH